MAITDTGSYRVPANASNYGPLIAVHADGLLRIHREVAFMQGADVLFRSTIRAISRQNRTGYEATAKASRLLDGGPSAINDQIVSCHVRCSLRRQEYHCASDILRSAHSPQRSSTHIPSDEYVGLVIGDPPG